VSIISILGSNACLEYIAQIAAETRGYNDIVDPLKLTQNFNFILENEIIATDVSVSIFLHKGLQLKKDSKQEQFLGNVNKESTITYAYKIQNKELIKNMETIPFQIQIKYSKLDGSKCMRVIAKEVHVTTNRDFAEQNMNLNVIGLRSQQETSRYASEGNYTKARMKQKSNIRMAKKCIQNSQATEDQKGQYAVWVSDAKKVNEVIKSSTKEEKRKGLQYGSDDDDASSGEEDNDDFNEAKLQKAAKKEQRLKERKNYRYENDEVSNVLYQASNPLYNAYSPQKK